MKLELIVLVGLVLCFGGCTKKQDISHNGSRLNINELTLISSEIKPRLRYILEDYLKTHNKDEAVIVIEVFKDSSCLIVDIAPTSRINFAPGVSEAPKGFFIYGEYKVFVYGEIVPDLFHRTNINSSFDYFTKINEINLQKGYAPMPYYFEATAWSYKVCSGKFVLTEKYLKAW
jgi:hypothetical protein